MLRIIAWHMTKLVDKEFGCACLARPVHIWRGKPLAVLG